MNYIIVLLILSLISPPAIAETHEYQISEVTRSIAYGKACEMADAGNQKAAIQQKVVSIILINEGAIKPKNAKILGYVVSENAIKTCGAKASN
jgi:hypothetical protein